MSNSKSKILIATVLVAIASGLGFLLISASTPQPAPKPASPSQTQKTPKTTVNYQGVEGQNALELLKQTHKVQTKTYEGLGELVTGIDGVTPDTKHFWAFYVNGEQSQVGAGSYTAKAADKLMWKLEKIQ